MKTTASPSSAPRSVPAAASHAAAYTAACVRYALSKPAVMLPAAYFVVALVLWDMALVVLLHVGVVGLFGVGVELMYRTFLFDWTVAKLLPGRLEVRARDRIRPRVSDVPVPESFGAAGLGAYARVWGRGVLSRQLWASMLPLLVFLVFVTGPLVALQILL